MKMKRMYKIIISSMVIFTLSIVSNNAIHAVTYNDWVIINGVKYFYNSLNEQIGTADAKKVIDVSEHQGLINWDAVKNNNTGASSIDGAIIRISAGTMREDYQLANNIAGARRNGIPIGVYIYSYADDTEGALEEARFTYEVIKKYGLENTQFPIYYDLESFETYNNGYRDVYAPSNSAQYETIVRAYMKYLNDRGIHNVQLYSYRDLIKSKMNTPYLLKYMGWIAAYTHRLDFDNIYYNGLFGWQYTSTLERVNGISGNVDVSCFYYKTPPQVDNVPSSISSIIKAQGLQYGNDYISGFSPKVSNQTVNTSKIKNLNTDQYLIEVSDANGNQIDYSSSVALKTGDKLFFKRKEGLDGSVPEYSFTIAVRSDINGNGKTDAADYLMIMDTILGKFNMNSAQTKAGDINGNGRIDAADYLMIMDNILGKFDIT